MNNILVLFPNRQGSQHIRSNNRDPREMSNKEKAQYIRMQNTVITTLLFQHLTFSAKLHCLAVENGGVGTEWKFEIKDSLE